MAQKNSSRGRAIRFADSVTQALHSSPALTLFFASGHRPDDRAMMRLAQRPAENTAFQIGHLPNPPEGWVELLAMGLAYDVTGLAPGGPAHAMPAEYAYGVDVAVSEDALEAVRITPGPHLAGSRPPLPVVRVLAGLGAELARLPGLRNIGWETAQSRMSPAYFMGAISAWLGGGAFPALGLTALDRLADGALQSVGLSLFTGYEMRLDAFGGLAVHEQARLAARIIHQLVHHGPAGLPSLAEALGIRLGCDLTASGGLLRIWREA